MTMSFSYGFFSANKNPSFPTPGPMKIAVGFFGAENHQLPRGGASAGKFDFPEKALRPDFATQVSPPCFESFRRVKHWM